jgi:hypothetical protein
MFSTISTGLGDNRTLMKRNVFILLATFSCTLTALAVDPPPDGGYPIQNTAEGEDALFSLTTGTDNTAMGFHVLYKNTTGSLNTASGSTAMFSNTLGTGNTATGDRTLYNNTTGSFNVAAGDRALYSNTTGSLNIAIGDIALYTNRSGMSNVAIGTGAMYDNTSGYDNTGIGEDSLRSNTTAVGNTGLGYRALRFNKNGNSNTAVGYYALTCDLNVSQYGSGNTAVGSTTMLFNTTGSNNVALGESAMLYNTTGNQNAAGGGEAMEHNTEGNNNTAYGYHSLFNNLTGSKNIALGFNAGNNLTGDSNIDIGNSGVEGESNTIRIGRIGQQMSTFIAGISGVTVASGVGVVIDANGQLGVMTSSARYKENIQPMSKASEVILSLRPVTFRYKKEIDHSATAQFGLVAEEVAKVDPDLVAKDKSGKPYTVRYEAVNAMLLNEFLKEHQKVEGLEQRLSEQDKINSELRSALKAQAAQIEKVNARVQASQPAARLVSGSE